MSTLQPVNTQSCNFAAFLLMHYICFHKKYQYRNVPCGYNIGYAPNDYYFASAFNLLIFYFNLVMALGIRI